jgi:hypothetical protein
MAILHQDNFGWYTTAHLLDQPAGYTSATGTYDVGLYGPFGGTGLVFLDATASITKTAPFPGGAPAGAFIMGAQRYLAALPAARETLLSFGLSGTVHVKIDVNPDGTLSIRRGDDVEIAASTMALDVARPFHLNVQVEVDHSGGSVVVLVTSNGTTSVFVNATGLDTQNGSSAWNEFTHHAVVANARLGNSIMQDSSGGGATAMMLGPNIRVQTFLPDSVGGHNEFTNRTAFVDRYKNVAKIKADGGVTKNATSTPGAIDTFGFQDIHNPDGRLYAATLIVVARKSAPSNKMLAPVIRQAGVDVLGPAVALTNEFKPYATVYETLPDGFGWTIDRWNAIEFGYADVPAPVTFLTGGTQAPPRKKPTAPQRSVFTSSLVP